MQAHEGKLNGIIDTVSAVHDIPELLKLLDNNGTICVVGVPPEPMHVPHMALLAGRKRVGGRYDLCLDCIATRVEIDLLSRLTQPAHPSCRLGLVGVDPAGMMLHSMCQQ